MSIVIDESIKNRDFFFLAESEMIVLYFPDDGPVFCPGVGFLLPLLVPSVPPQRLPLVIILTLTLISALILPAAFGGCLRHRSG